MEEKKDLWELVRKKLEKKSDLTTENFTDEEKIENINVKENSDNINESDEITPSKYLKEE